MTISGKMTYDTAGNPYKVEIGDSTIEIHSKKMVHEIPASFIVNSSKITLENGGGVNKLLHEHAGKKMHEACMKVHADHRGVRLRPGHAVLTCAGDLPASCVVHTVGCDYRLTKLTTNTVDRQFGATTITLKKITKQQAYKTHASAYKSSIVAANSYIQKLADPHGPHKDVRSPVDLSDDVKAKLQKRAKDKHPFGISFPAIGTNIFEFPKKKACDIAMKVILKEIHKNQGKPGVKKFHLSFTPEQQTDLEVYRNYFKSRFQK